VMSWFESLQPRERNVLLGGAVAAVLIAFWAFVWQPLDRSSENLRVSIESKEQVLTNLYRAQGLTAVAQDPSTARGNQSLVVLIDQTAQAGGLGGALTRTRPDGATRINVSFENAAFDKLLTWLVQLQQVEGVYVEGASINDTRQRGLVTGNLLLSRL